MAAFEEGEVFPVADTELSTGLVFGGGEVISIILGVFFYYYSFEARNKCDYTTISLHYFYSFALSAQGDQGAKSVKSFLEVSPGDPLPPLLCVMCDQEFTEDSEDVFWQVPTICTFSNLYSNPCPKFVVQYITIILFSVSTV